MSSQLHSAEVKVSLATRGAQAPLTTTSSDVTRPSEEPLSFESVGPLELPSPGTRAGSTPLPEPTCVPGSSLPQPSNAPEVSSALDASHAAREPRAAELRVTE